MSRDLLALSFKVVGLAFAVIAAVTAIFTLSFVFRAEPATGIVIDYSRLKNSITLMPEGDETGVLYYPVVAYRAADGVEYQLTGRSGRAERRYPVGEQVPVLFLSSNPSDARLKTLMGVWGTPVILAGLALVFLVVGLAAPHGFGGSRRA